jgi:serine/threonine protein kinase
MAFAASTSGDTLAFAPPPVAAPAVGDMPLPPGYLGLGVIGRSEANVVHRAYDLASGATVAVSVPMTPQASSPDVIARAARVMHHAAARVLGQAPSAAGVCCVMEFVEGRPLSEVLPLLRDRTLASLTLDDLVAPCCIDRRRLRPDIVALTSGRGVWHRLSVRWIIDVCAVLREAHAAGLSILSPRPSRLLLRPDGSVAITGLGLATIGSDPASRAADVRDVVACLKELLSLEAVPSAAALRAAPPDLEAACEACLARAGDDDTMCRLSDSLERWLSRPSSSGLAGLVRRLWPVSRSA